MTDCTIDISQLYSALNDPNANPDFLTPGYVEPTGPGSAWSVKIFFNGTAYQFCWFLSTKEGDSLTITSVFNERGSARFVIADYDVDGCILPFIPVEEMYMEIWNYDEDYLYFAGYTRDIDSRLLDVRDDGTEACEYIITCTDLYHELERKPVSKLYTNKTLGFIIRDVINRYTVLDASEIDPTLGFTLASYPVNAKTPAQVLSHIMDLTNTTYIIDPATKKIFLTSKDSSDVRFPVTITDANVYSYFDNKTFKLRRQNDVIKNQIEFWYTEKYNKGTVNVAITSNIVVGYGGTPETEWDDLQAGMQFKLAASDAVYNVEKNNSAGATQELRLSSPFAESTASDQAYELRGNRRRVYVSDEESIGLMRTMGRGDGIFTYVVSEDSNAFTFAEARRFASAMLALSRPLPQGGGNTDNWAWGFQPLFAGMVLPFDLPNSKRFVGDIVVQQITITDTGAEIPPDENMYGQYHPKVAIQMTWTAAFNKSQTQMRKMMQDLRKVKINLEDEQIEDYRRIPESFFLRDCVHASLPTSVSEALTLDDNVSARVETDGPLFYTELDFVLNELDYSFTSN